jgi:hypothetical protein
MSNDIIILINAIKLLNKQWLDLIYKNKFKQLTLLIIITNNKNILIIHLELNEKQRKIVNNRHASHSVLCTTLSAS